MLLDVMSFFALILLSLGQFKCQLVSNFGRFVSPMNPYHGVVIGSRVYKDTGTENTLDEKTLFSLN